MRVASLVLLIAALYAVPAAASPYLLHVLILSCLYAIPAVGLNLMLGYTGLVSLGHIAFAGIGAYTAAWLTVDARLGYWTALAIAVAASALAGALIGAICLRFRSHFFMIVTLAFGLVLYSVMNNWDDVTRGAQGFPGIPRPPGIASLQSFYWLALSGALLALAVQWRVVRSRFGRILVALRQDERLAQAKGVNAALCKTAVFALGSAIAGFGGVLLVSFLRVAAPASFTLAESINAVLIVIVGGAGTLAGPALGALLFVGVPEYLRVAAEWRLVVFGALLVLIMLFAPRGVAGMLAAGWRRLAVRRT
jgi:branched-chain amino acid transport system permease protein